MRRTHGDAPIFLAGEVIETLALIVSGSGSVELRVCWPV